jgi:hypothetical protein
MYNTYLTEQLGRMRQEDDLARAEHQRLMAENGLDLWSVVRRAVAERLARLRLPRLSLPERSAPADLHLVSRAQLERRVDRAA